MNLRNFFFLIVSIGGCCQLTYASTDRHHRPITNDQECSYDLVVSIPDKLTLPRDLSQEVAKTHEILLDLINNAKKTIHMTTFELTLLKESTKTEEFDESLIPGEQIVTALSNAAQRGVEVVILYGLKQNSIGEVEEKRLVEAGVKLIYFDVASLLGRGIQHSKLLITDKQNLYIGSANLNWQSYTQVMELGISYKNCFLLANDLDKVFETWKLTAETGFIHDQLPQDLTTQFNMQNPMKLKMDNMDTDVYFASSPKAFDGENNERTEDLNSILETIDRAEKFVLISVMNYNPLYQNGRPEYWPVIENALVNAMRKKNIDIKLLVSVRENKNMNQRQLKVLKALDKFRIRQDALGNGGSIGVKIFTVPVYDKFQSKLPFARVKHDKYIITDKSVYIGTSNWSADYFYNTCGVGISITPNPKELEKSDKNIILRMKEIFDMDYDSLYTKYATDF